MKIVLIHGQNHKGSSYHIGWEIARKVEGENEITEFFLPKDLNHFCVGCYNCVHDETKCPFYEEKSVIINAIREAKLLIFTTPTYCLRALAPMKSFLDFTFTDWMPHKPKKEMFSKMAVVVSTSAGTGAKSAVKDITTAMFYCGVPYIKGYGVALQAMNWDSVSEKNKAKVDKATSKLARKISRKKKLTVPISIKFLFTMLRMMHLGNMSASPEEHKYWEDNGWLGKDRPWKSK